MSFTLNPAADTFVPGQICIPHSQNVFAGMMDPKIHEAALFETRIVAALENLEQDFPTERTSDRQEIHLPNEPLSNQWLEENAQWLEEHAECYQKERDLCIDLQMLQGNLQMAHANLNEAYTVLENQRLEILVVKKAKVDLAEELEAERKKLAASGKKLEELTIKAGVVTPPEIEAAEKCLFVSSQPTETL